MRQKNHISVPTRYSNDLKRQLARRYLRGEFTLTQAAKEYGLPTKHTAYEFVRWYGKQLAYLQQKKLPAMSQTTDGKNERRAKHPSVTDTPFEDLSKEELIRQLQQTQRALQGWQTLVLQAEETLNIQIVKKSGAKPSKK